MLSTPPGGIDSLPARLPYTDSETFTAGGTGTDNVRAEWLGLEDGEELVTGTTGWLRQPPEEASGFPD